MRKSDAIIFPPFALDVVNQRLRRGDQPITLRPKPFAVLFYLLQRPGQLVTKGELLDACWPETAVTDTVLKVCIREIREALGDDSQSPKFIETAHRRGYCFIGGIAKVEQGDSETLSQESAEIRARTPRPTIPSAIELVGRDAELAQMREWFEQAEGGARQIVFVTGEAGIGKTALIEAVLKEVAASPDIWIARGQCLEQYGASEAYLPVLEAISRLCREPDTQSVIELLFRLAPTWVTQIPALINTGDRESLRRETLGATRDRMLREMAEALEVLTAKTPLLLVLEDLHWSDYSTLDLISAIARRREPARLMLIGTYRPVDLILSDHPLKAVKQELQVHRRCEELALEYLTERAIADYLNERFSGHEFPLGLAEAIHRRTEGNPLFMVNVVNHFLGEGLIIQTDGGWKLSAELGQLEVGVPENIRQMITKQIDRLSSEDQQVLEAASISGMKFSALAVASALAEDVVGVEARCEEFARRNLFLRARGAGEFPDGTVSGRYGFIHSLYINALYDRIPAARRARLHLSMAERGERIYGDRVGEIASELMMHFEQGRDYRRAIKYLRQAADIDSRRYANREAIDNLDRAFKFVRRLPETEQEATRMAVLEQRGMVRRAMGDMTKAAEDFIELSSLAHERDELETEVKALLQAASAFSWVDRRQCPELFERAVALIPHLKDELLQAHTQAYYGYWHSRFLSWRDEDEHACEKAIEAAKRAGNRALLSMHVARHSYYPCLRSDYETACRVAEEGTWLALETGDGFDYLYCQFYWAWALLHLGHWGKLRAVLAAGTELADKNGQYLIATLLSLETAWLHEQALDFESARDLCERILTQTRGTQHETGHLLCLILLGTAHVELREYDRALECFNEVTHTLEHERGMMEWILRLPLQFGLSQYWLARGELERARQEADKLCELASLPGERTYVALGRQTLAAVAMAEQDWIRAGKEIVEALSVLDGAEAPLAEWRVHATAAVLCEQTGRTDDAARHRTQSANVLGQLAGSLEEADELRTSLLKGVASP